MFERATHLLGATEAWHQKNQFSRTPKEHEMRKNAIASLQQTLGEEAFAEAWEEGRAMSIEQAIAYAREGQAISLGGGNQILQAKNEDLTNLCK